MSTTLDALRKLRALLISPEQAEAAGMPEEWSRTIREVDEILAQPPLTLNKHDREIVRDIEVMAGSHDDKTYGWWSRALAISTMRILQKHGVRIGETGWLPMASAPKDEPILALCKHDADPYWLDEEHTTLTLYAGHAEGLTRVEDGPHVVVWGGAWDDRSYEEPSAGHMPDWWFRYGSDFEEVANPIGWLPIPKGESK